MCDVPPPEAPPWLRWVAGFALLAFGTAYTAFADRIWRWNIRMAQKPIQRSIIRFVGVLFALGGLFTLIFGAPK
jgi:hypothetical protein